MHALIALARAGLLWTGAQHANLATPPHPIVARRVASDADVELARSILYELVQREAALRVPVLLCKSYGFERVLPVVRIPLAYRDAQDFDRMLALMLACDFLVEVPEAELLPLAGYVGRPPGPCLPCREYWGEGARGFRVSERGKRAAAY